MSQVRAQRNLEIVGLCTTATLHVAAVYRLASNLDPLLGIITIMIGFVLADFLTGFVHWFGDTVGSASWPIVGGGFIRPFREHHVDPTDLTRHDFVELNGANAVVTVPFMVVAVIFAPDAPVAMAIMVAAMFFALVTNQIHQWAHTAEPPHFVRWLQRSRIILSPEHHKKHHTFPHDRAYCITTGWVNPVLDSLRLFRAAERVLAWIHPRLLSAESHERRRVALMD